MRYSIWGLFLTSLLLVQCQRNENIIPITKDHENQIRIATWNIEHLGKRSPQRSISDIHAIGLSIQSFLPDCIAIQEVRNISLIDTICSSLAPTYQYDSNQDDRIQRIRILYNSSVLNLLFSEYLRSDTPYPGHSECIPLVHIFNIQPTQIPLMIIAIHLNPKNEQIRINEIKWILNWLNNQNRVSVMKALIGDFNARGDDPIHELLDGWEPVLKENGSGTAFASQSNPEGIESDYIYIHSSKTVNPLNSIVLRSDFFRKNMKTYLNIYSDHFPVYTNITLKNTTQNTESESSKNKF